jgi:hypothetical protein
VSWTWPALAVALGALGCEEPPPTVAEQLAAIEASRKLEEAQLRSPCTDVVFNAANQSAVVKTACPRPDHRLTFEKDVDNDAWIVCRCPRDGGAP